MLTERETDLSRAALAHLKEAHPYLIPEARLRSSMRRAILPPAASSEVDAAFAHLDAERRIHIERTPDGVKIALTDTGRAWLAQNP